ncbi:MAG: hypothetical protein ACI4R8_00450 [Candidatus Caccovivens sp.]
MIRRKFIISTFIHSFIMIAAIVLMFTVFKSVWWAIFIGFVVIPFIIAIFQKENAIKEVESMIKCINDKEKEFVEKSDSQKIQNLYEGELEYFSMSEIAMCAINLVDFKAKLSPEKFNKVMNEFNEFTSNPTNQQQILIDLNQFGTKILEIQEKFENIIDEQIYFDGTIKKSK